MPNWARLPSTRKDQPLRDRMASALENGYGDEGPLAKVLAIGGCFGCLGAITLGPIIVVGWFMFHMFV